MHENEHDEMPPLRSGTPMPKAGDALPWILDTMKRNAPILVFHPDEKYLTYNVPDYLQHVELYNSKGELLASPPLTPRNLPMGETSTATYLNIPGGQEWLRSGDLKKTKIYVHALQWTHGGRTGAEFQYFFFYPYNGRGFINFRFPGIADHDLEIPAGAHEGDWESIIVRTDSDGNVIGIYCNQHGSGQWYLPEQIQWQGTQPMIYVARSGHPSFDSVGHFPTEGGDFTFSFFGYTVGVQLDNATGRGARLPTSEIAELVATSYFPGVTVQEPWWLDYLGRFGRVVFTDKDKAETTMIITNVLDAVMPQFIARKIADAVTSKVFSILGDIAPDGPEPPKAKGWWNQIAEGGPWANVTRRWSGNVKISSLPGGVDPRTRSNVALAPFGDQLCMAYRGESSTQLYEAWYDGVTWRGNTPIRIGPNNVPLSPHGPALASHDGRLYMAYQAADSNILYLSWFDGTRWQGNVRIETDRGLAESPMPPALAAYEGELHLVFKGVGSNAIYQCRYGGGAWHGNTPIETDHGVPTSTTSPALAVFNGTLYLAFKGENSDQMYSASYDGARWRGNIAIQTDHGAAASPFAPWMAASDGSLILLFKGSDSDAIYLVESDEGGWIGNQRLSRTTPIAPATNAPGAIAPLGNELITVFKAYDSTALYQAACTSSTGARGVRVTQLPRR